MQCAKTHLSTVCGGQKGRITMEMGMNALIRSLLWLEAKDCDGNWHGTADNMTLLEEGIERTTYTTILALP